MKRYHCKNIKTETTPRELTVRLILRNSNPRHVTNTQTWSSTLSSLCTEAFAVCTILDRSFIPLDKPFNHDTLKIRVGESHSQTDINRIAHSYSCIVSVFRLLQQYCIVTYGTIACNGRREENQRCSYTIQFPRIGASPTFSQK